MSMFFSAFLKKTYFLAYLQNLMCYHFIYNYIYYNHIYISYIYKVSIKEKKNGSRYLLLNALANFQ